MLNTFTFLELLNIYTMNYKCRFMQKVILVRHVSQVVFIMNLRAFILNSGLLNASSLS